MIYLEQGARDEALHAKVDALRAELGALHEKLDAVPILISSLFAAVYEKLDAVPRLVRSLFAAGREKLDAVRSGRGGNKSRKHHGHNGFQSTDATWRSGEGDAP